MKSGFEKEIAGTTLLMRHGWLTTLFWVGFQIISDEHATHPNGVSQWNGKAAGETPTAAVETTALPKLSLRI